MKKVTANTTEMQRVIRDYYKQLYANKMNNLEEMEKFLERYNLLRLNQEETRKITNKQSNFTPKTTRVRTNKIQSEKR